MMRAMICGILLCWSMPVLAAEEIDKSKLADCQVHVVGQYMPENDNVDCRVKVMVKSTGKPMVVVLCSYMETQWNLEIAKDADVRQIVISGWFEQTVKNVPESIPVKLIVGGHNGDRRYFWAYSKYSAEGFRVQEAIRELLGKEIDTFQGAYGGKEFLIDGVRNQQDPQAAIHNIWLDVGVPKSSDVDLSIRQILAGGSDPKTVELYVRKLFEIETKEKEARIKQAEADLQKVKEKFAKRLKSSEEIIKSRVDALMKEIGSQPQAAAEKPGKDEVP